MIGGTEGPTQLPARPGVRTGFWAFLRHPTTPPPQAWTSAASAEGSGPSPPWHNLLGSDKRPRPHPKAETACGAALGAAFHQGRSGSTEVNRVQVHFSNICKLLSVTAKNKLLGEETPGFLLLFFSFAFHTHPSIQLFR